MAILRKWPLLAKYSQSQSTILSTFNCLRFLAWVQSPDRVNPSVKVLTQPRTAPGLRDRKKARQRGNVPTLPAVRFLLAGFIPIQCARELPKMSHRRGVALPPAVVRWMNNSWEDGVYIALKRHKTDTSNERSIRIQKTFCASNCWQGKCCQSHRITANQIALYTARKDGNPCSFRHHSNS